MPMVAQQQQQQQQFTPIPVAGAMAGTPGGVYYVDAGSGGMAGGFVPTAGVMQADAGVGAGGAVGYRPAAGTQMCGVGGTGCGAAEVGCGTYDEATVLSYVGAGGDYKAETSYKYVGSGAGDFDVVTVPANVKANYCLIVVGLCLLVPLLILLVSFFSHGERVETTPPPTPAPLLPTTTPAPLVGKCMFWGDPHFWTFDNRHHDTVQEDEYANGDFWIVKTPTIWIQGRYRPTQWLIKRGNHRACAHAIAFGGPFMQNNKFIVEAMNGQITYNGLPVMTTFPTTFSQGPVSARYHNQGAPKDPRMSSLALHIVDVSLPHNIHVQVDRWKEHIDGEITMSQHPGMQGHCGNFNSNPNDDQSAHRDQLGGHNSILSPPISPSQLLFPPSTFVDDQTGPPLAGTNFAGRA